MIGQTNTSHQSVSATGPFGWLRTACRFNGEPVYYHAGRDELAVEAIQLRRLVPVPHTAERQLRHALNAEVTR